MTAFQPWASQAGQVGNVAFPPNSPLLDPGGKVSLGGKSSRSTPVATRAALGQDGPVKRVPSGGFID